MSPDPQENDVTQLVGQVLSHEYFRIKAEKAVHDMGKSYWDERLRRLRRIGSLLVSALVLLGVTGWFDLQRRFSQLETRAKQIDGLVQQVESNVNRAKNHLDESERILERSANLQNRTDERIAAVQRQIREQVKDGYQLTSDAMEQVLDAKKEIGGLTKLGDDLTLLQSSVTGRLDDADIVIQKTKQAGEAAESASERLAIQAQQFDGQARDLEKAQDVVLDRVNNVEKALFEKSSLLIETDCANHLPRFGISICLKRVRSGRLQRLRVFPYPRAKGDTALSDLDYLDVGTPLEFDNPANGCTFELRPTFYHRHFFTSDIVGVDLAWKHGDQGRCQLLTPLFEGR